MLRSYRGNIHEAEILELQPKSGAKHIFGYTYGYMLWLHVTYMVPYGSIWSRGWNGSHASAIGVLANLSGMEVFVQRDVDGNSARDQERPGETHCVAGPPAVHCCFGAEILRSADFLGAIARIKQMQCPQNLQPREMMRNV